MTPIRTSWCGKPSRARPGRSRARLPRGTPYDCRMSPLEASITAWHESADRIITLGAAMSDDDWLLPTDCPGWSVGDIVAHLTHLESLLTTEPHPADTYDGSIHAEVGPRYTESGVDSYRDQPPAHVRDEFAAATTAARTVLTSLPADPDAVARHVRRAPNGRGERYCATARSTFSCMNKTCGARSAGPAAGTVRRPGSRCRISLRPCPSSSGRR